MKINFKNLKVIFCIFCAGIFSNNLQAQQISFSVENVLVDYQLNSNPITSIIQDSDGFMLFGTKNGVFKFDGFNSEQAYYSFNRMFSNKISCFYKDKKGNLWIGTDKELLLRDKNRINFEIFNLDSIINVKSRRIRKIKNIGEDDYGNILILTESYIYKFNPQTKHAEGFSLEKMLFPFNNFIISKDYILGFSIANFIRINKNNLKQEEIDVQIAKIKSSVKSIKFLGDVYSSIPSHNGFLLTIQNKGLTFLSFKNDIPVYEPCFDKIIQRESKNIKLLYIDKSNNYWFVLNDNKLYFYNSSFTKIKPVFENSNYYSYGANSIECITEDYSGNIWIGLRNGLAQKISLVEPLVDFIKTPKNEEAKGTGLITSIKQDRSGKLWISTNRNIYSYFNNKWHLENPVTPEWSGIKTGIKKIEIDNSGNIYFCRDKIIWRKKGNEDFHIFFKIEPKSLNPKFFIKDFVTTNQGIFLIADQLYAVDKNGKLLKSFKSPQKDPIKSVTWNYKDKILILSNQFIHSFDINKFSYDSESIDSKNDKDGSGFHSIFFDKTGNLWLSTFREGLYRIKFNSNNKPSIVKEDINPLINGSNIREILADDENNLWIATLALGLWKYNPKTSFLKNIFITDTLKNRPFYHNASLNSYDGKIYFGSFRGIYCINTKPLIQNKNESNLVLTGFSAAELSFVTDKLVSVQEISLPMNCNSFAFYCSLLDFTDHKKNFYFCKLEGYENDYRNLGNKNYCSYNNLPSGDYKLTIKAINSNGTYSKDTLTLRIHVPVPVYRTWWAISSYILFVSLVVFSFNQYKQKVNLKKIQQIRNHSKEYIEFQESERSRISKELHDSVNQVLSYIKIKLSSLHEAIDENSIGDILKVEKLLDDTNMEIRRISHNLHPIILDDLGLQGGLNNLVRTTKEHHDINIEFHYLNLPPRLNKDIQINIYRIVQEGINNIIKHSKATKCNINVAFHKPMIEIKIQDNGKGFENGNLKNGKLSFGLRNMQERANFFGGKFLIDSIPGKGVSIFIQIPYYMVNNELQKN